MHFGCWDTNVEVVAVPAARGRLRCKIIRIAWLITRLVRHDSVGFAVYRDRFGLGVRSFRRDMASIRDAGVYVDTDPQLAIA